MRTSIDPDEFSKIITKYPAHLHINLQPEYQGMGLGTRLIEAFENHLFDLGVTGVHLHTTNYNKKAIPFYNKNGYILLREDKMNHYKFEDLKLLTYGKILSN